MTRWMILAVMTLALPALAQRPHGGPGQGSHGGPMRDLSPEDQKAIHDYKLSTSNTDKLMDANRRLMEMAEKDPQMRKDNPMTARTLDDSVKKVDSLPAAKTVLKQVGLSSREFVVGTFTMMTAAMWHGMQKSYPQAQVPPYVNPDNLKFVDAHPELVKKWSSMPKGHKKGKGHGDDGDDANDE